MGTYIKVYMKSKSNIYNATALFYGKEVVLLQGSQISAKTAMALRINVKKSHLVDLDNTILENIDFSSVSAAAQFVSGRSANGWVEWRLENGDLLETVRNENFGNELQKDEALSQKIESAQEKADSDRFGTPAFSFATEKQRNIEPKRNDEMDTGVSV